MAKEEIKKLTQAQRNYLVKRINEIADTKIGKLNRIRNGYTTVINLIGSNTLIGIAEGKVKLRNKTSLMADLKARAGNTNTSYTNLSATTFVDMKSLKKFNNDVNKKIEAANKAKQKRISSVKSEAGKLRDSVMLDGSLAVELLAKFEKKEF